MKIALIICIIIFVLTTAAIIFVGWIKNKIDNNYLVQRILQGVTEGEKSEYNHKKKLLDIMLYTLYSVLALVTAISIILVLEILPILEKL